MPESCRRPTRCQPSPMAAWMAWLQDCALMLPFSCRRAAKHQPLPLSTVNGAAPQISTGCATWQDALPDSAQRVMTGPPPFACRRATAMRETSLSTQAIMQ